MRLASDEFDLQRCGLRRGTIQELAWLESRDVLTEFALLRVCLPAAQSIYIYLCDFIEVVRLCIQIKLCYDGE